MSICKINLNQELNGIEISFDAKPEAATIEIMKSNGFRWNRVKKLWYAKQTAERITFAESLGTITETTPPAAAAEVITLDNLGVKPANFSYYGSDLAKLIREDLKRRGVKGVTVRTNNSGYTTSITVTVKATNNDLVSLEEAAERHDEGDFMHDMYQFNELYVNGAWLYLKDYEAMTDEEKEGAYYNYLSTQITKTNSFSVYHNDRDRDCWTLTTPFYNKCLAIFRIANQWNYDNSDSMSDYFDVGYYLDIDIKKSADFQPRATMTETERTAYAAEIKAKEEKEEAERIAYEQEQERRKEEAAKYEAWRKEAEENIYNNVVIEDLEENQQIFINNLIGGAGKENTLEELREYTTEHPHSIEKALITRNVIFKTESAFNDFSKLFLHDFDFLAGKGGTASEDVRLSSFEEYSRLNNEQRETIKFYNNDCIAVYFNNKLQYVINPEGFSYARYVFLTAEETETENGAETLEKLRKESEALTPFYIPAPVEEQSENITEGEQITIYQCDGWILNNVYAGAGTVTSCEPGTYAQYEGIYINLTNGKKTKRVFIRNGNSCLIYKGIKPTLPDKITREQISANMYHLYNYDRLIPNIYNYYQEQGEEPLLNTWQH